MSVPIVGDDTEPPYRLRDVATHWRETAEPAFYVLIGAGLIATSQSSLWVVWPWLAVAAAGIFVLLIGLAVIDDRMRRASNAR
jgi:hypothetical protein